MTSRNISLVCMKLPSNFINNLDDMEKNIPSEDFVEEPEQPSLYLEDYNISWKRCKVGSENEYDVNADVRRNTFSTNVRPKFKYNNDTKIKLVETLGRLYSNDDFEPPIHSDCYGDSVHVKTKKLIIPHFSKFRSRYDDIYEEYGNEAESINNDFDDLEEYDSTDSSCKLLCYIKGGFFKPHTDTRIGRKFATTLVMIPNPNLIGGDLVFTIKSESVYDPDGLLEYTSENAKLKVDSLKYPIMISFKVNILHEVTEIISGYRLCLKMVQSMSLIKKYFVNTEKIDVSSEFKELTQNIQIKNYEKQIQELIDKIKELKYKISEINNSTYILNHNINDNDIIILSTGPPLNSKNGIIKLDQDFLSQLNNAELNFTIEIFKRYPYSTIRILSGKRNRIAYGTYFDEDEVLSLCKNPGKGWVNLYGFDKNNTLKYFDHPFKISVGTRVEPISKYNDETYSGYDEVDVYAIFVQQHPYINL